VKGTTSEEKKTLLLNDRIDQYRYLNQSTVYDIKGVSDEKKFAELSTDFLNYFSKEETQCIFKILSIVLNMGNLLFRKELSKNNE
jgi:myosin heavy subunit